MIKEERILKCEPGDRFAREVIVGGEQQPKRGVSANRKTIILLGRSRAGKTTLINAFVNYLFGVKEGDDFRYALQHIQQRNAQSTNSESSSLRPSIRTYRTYGRTRHLITYVFNNTILNHPIAFVDTPPIDSKGDTMSPTWLQDDAFEQIRKWFRGGYYCPVEDLEVWFVIPSFDSHIRQIVWQTVSTVMREIECPLVRLVPIITFAKNSKPINALNSLERIGYTNLTENENFYCFNSATVLTREQGNVVDYDGLSFAQNYAHMQMILNNLQKDFQWMKLADGRDFTTVMQLKLNRDGDDRSRLYATDSICSQRLNSTRDLTRRRFSNVADVSRLSEDSVNPHRSTPISTINRDDHVDDATFTDDWSSSTVDYTLPWENQHTIPRIESIRNKEPKPIDFRPIEMMTPDNGQLLTSKSRDADISSTEYDSSDSSSTLTELDECYKAKSRKSSMLQIYSLKRAEDERYMDTAGDTITSEDNSIGERRIPNTPPYQYSKDSLTSSTSSAVPSNRSYRLNERTYDKNSSSSYDDDDLSTVEGSMRKRSQSQNGCQMNRRRCERHPTGSEYEIVRFRRRRVKNESTQTSSSPIDVKMETVEKCIYLSSEPVSDGSEYFSSDVEEMKLRRPKSWYAEKPTLSLTSRVNRRLSLKETWV